MRIAAHLSTAVISGKSSRCIICVCQGITDHGCQGLPWLHHSYHHNAWTLIQTMIGVVYNPFYHIYMLFSLGLLSLTILNPLYFCWVSSQMFNIWNVCMYVIDIICNYAYCSSIYILHKHVIMKIRIIRASHSKSLTQTVHLHLLMKVFPALRLSNDAMTMTGCKTHP